VPHHREFIYLFIVLLFYYSYVHTRLGSFVPSAPTPSLTTHSAPFLSPPPHRYPAETILPLSLIFTESLESQDSKETIPQWQRLALWPLCPRPAGVSHVYMCEAVLGVPGLHFNSQDPMIPASRVPRNPCLSHPSPTLGLVAICCLLAKGGH
jgi:hypothetical protein